MDAATSDEQLMLEFRGGARAAFEELFARYREPLYGFFRRRLDQRARAEELAQEVFLAVLRGRERWEPRALVRTWLYGIALNLLRAERRRAARESPQAAAAETDTLASREGDHDDALWVRRGVEQLEDGDREILMLREFEQLRYDEIAALLRIPVNTVRSRLFRARLALRDLLQPAAAPAKASGDIDDAQKGATQPGGAQDETGRSKQRPYSAKPAVQT